ncbi:MAG: YraN family protein [Terracidiphilus sp.]|jgi:putative endonuclease
MQPFRDLRVGALRLAIDGLDRVSRLGGREPVLPPHLITGFEGEKEAYFHLLRKGYLVVATRWSAGNLPGDIDIVAWKDTLLCIIEVKTRTAHDMTPAEVAVDSHKRSILRRLARRYMQQLPQASGSPPELPQVRFDVISVYLLPGEKPEITHFENAFGWKEFRRDWE